MLYVKHTDTSCTSLTPSHCYTSCICVNSIIIIMIINCTSPVGLNPLVFVIMKFISYQNQTLQGSSQGQKWQQKTNTTKRMQTNSSKLRELKKNTSRSRTAKKPWRKCFFTIDFKRRYWLCLSSSDRLFQSCGALTAKALSLFSFTSWHGNCQQIPDWGPQTECK